MSVLVISDEVRLAVGGANCAALSRGEGLPGEAQCFRCGEAVLVAGGSDGSVSLSVVAFDRPSGGLGSITLFAHVEHSPSRLFTPDEFRAVADPRPSAVEVEGPAVFVDGQRVA